MQLVDDGRGRHCVLPAMCLILLVFGVQCAGGAPNADGDIGSGSGEEFSGSGDEIKNVESTTSTSTSTSTSTTTSTTTSPAAISQADSGYKNSSSSSSSSSSSTTTTTRILPSPISNDDDSSTTTAITRNASDSAVGQDVVQGLETYILIIIIVGG